MTCVKDTSVAPAAARTVMLETGRVTTELSMKDASGAERAWEDAAEATRFSSADTESGSRLDAPMIPAGGGLLKY